MSVYSDQFDGERSLLHMQGHLLGETLRAAVDGDEESAGSRVDAQVQFPIIGNDQRPHIQRVRGYRREQQYAALRDSDRSA